MRVDVFTIFPGLVEGFCSESLLGKCRENGLLDLRCHDPREHTTDVHRTVDDAPQLRGARRQQQRVLRRVWRGAPARGCRCH